MTNNIRIHITEHARNRYYERFATGLVNTLSYSARAKFADQELRAIFRDAVYISDNPEGILFRNEKAKADMIIRDRQLRTIMRLDKRRLAA